MANEAAPIFEIHHGETVIRVADDWSGHVLIEQLYDGLRQARRSRDVGHVPVTAPAPGSEVASRMLEIARFHGFRSAEGGVMYQASADQVVALMTAAREQGRKDALLDAQPTP